MKDDFKYSLVHLPILLGTILDGKAEIVIEEIVSPGRDRNGILTPATKKTIISIRKKNEEKTD